MTESFKAGVFGGQNEEEKERLAVIEKLMPKDVVIVPDLIRIDPFIGQTRSFISPVNMHYHIAVRGVQSGPFSVDELRRKLAAGEVGAGDLCWQEGWAERRPVGVVLGLADAPPALPARAPATATVTPATSGLAIASLVLGVIGFVVFLTALPAVICGHIARSKIKAAQGALGGAGMALAGLILGYVMLGLSLVMIPAIIIPTVGAVRTYAQYTMDAGNLRQIGTASLIYAMDHDDKLPVAEDGWSYAATLARDAGLTDAEVWFAGDDRLGANGPSGVLADNSRDIAPAFRAARLSYAMPLGGITTDMPATTPIAWTRGLRPDGTWADDGPHGTRGGHIVFLGGNVMFVRQVKPDMLVRFDDGGATLNIREALPPGVVVFEP